MVTSLPFLVFSGPITDLLGHINVIVVGMVAYAARMIGYSLIEDPKHVYPFEVMRHACNSFAYKRRVCR